MTDERGPDDLVEIVRATIMGNVNVDEGWRTLENSVNAATKAVLAAIEPLIQERERAAKREVVTAIQIVAEAAIDDSTPPRNAYDRGFADAAAFLSDECRRQFRELDAATTDTGEDVT